MRSAARMGQAGMYSLTETLPHPASHNTHAHTEHTRLALFCSLCHSRLQTSTASTTVTRTQTASASTQPNVEVSTSVSCPNTVDPSAYTDADIYNLMLSLKCDFARIAGVPVSAAVLTQFVSYALGIANMTNIASTATINQATEANCTALLATTAVATRRLSAADVAAAASADCFAWRPLSAMLVEDEANFKTSKPSADAASRMLQSASNVTAVTTGFGATLKLFVTADSPVLTAVPAGTNAVDFVANVVNNAVAVSKTAAGAKTFSLTASTWTQASNMTSLSSWNGLSIFSVDAVSPFLEVIGTYTAPDANEGVGSNTTDKVPVVLGVTLGVTLGAVLFAVLLVVLVQKSRREDAEAEAAAADAALAAPTNVTPRRGSVAAPQRRASAVARRTSVTSSAAVPASAVVPAATPSAAASDTSPLAGAVGPGAVDAREAHLVAADL